MSDPTRVSSVIGQSFKNQAILTGAKSYTALAGGGQTGATLLLDGVNQVDTVVSAADSVMLPYALPGTVVWVLNNDSTDSMQVFGQLTETINGVASATGVAHQAGVLGAYVCSFQGLWAQILGTTGAGAPGQFSTLNASGAAVLQSTLSVAGGLTPSGGIVGTMKTRIPDVDIGSVAYGSLGTDGVHVAGTIYVAEVFWPFTKVCTGVAILNGSTVGTDSMIVGLYGSAGGNILSNSALAGTLTVGANAFQEIPFTALRTLPGGRYWIAMQSNGTTDKTRKIAANTFLNLTKSFTGSFGTLTALTVPTNTTADVGPIAYVY